MNAVERAAQAPRQRLGEQRLADPRHVLDQQVPVGEQGDEGELDALRLAQQHPRDGVAQAVQLPGLVAGRGTGFGGRLVIHHVSGSVPVGEGFRVLVY